MIFRDQQPVSGYAAPAGPTTFMLDFRNGDCAPHQLFGRRSRQSPESGGADADDDMSGLERPYGFLGRSIFLTEPGCALNVLGHGIQPRAIQRLWVGVSRTCGQEPLAPFRRRRSALSTQRGGALLPEGSRAPKVEQSAMPYGSGTSAVTLPISSNSVFEVYSLIEIVP